MPRRKGWSARSARVGDRPGPGRRPVASLVIRVTRHGYARSDVRLVRFGLQRRDLLGDVDSHRAPHDAAATADTARTAELVVPGAELVREPLPVPALRRRPDRAS